MPFNQFSTDSWQSDQMQADAEAFDPKTNPQGDGLDEEEDPSAEEDE